MREIYYRACLILWLAIHEVIVCMCLWKINCLIQYIQTTVSPPSKSPCSPHFPSPSDPFLLCLLFWKEQASERKLLTRTKQDTIRQVKNPHLEARQGNSMGGKESQGKRVRAIPAPPVRSPSKTTSYEPVQTHEGPSIWRRMMLMLKCSEDYIHKYNFDI